jgi:hypothetical protein
MPDLHSSSTAALNNAQCSSPIITVLPLGPSVALTAFAKISTPLNIPCLASFPKITSLLAYPLFVTTDAANCINLAGRGRAARDRTMFIMLCSSVYDGLWDEKTVLEWGEKVKRSGYTGNGIYWKRSWDTRRCWKLYKIVQHTYLYLYYHDLVYTHHGESSSLEPL